MQARVCDVVVPVFRGVEETKACVRSVLDAHVTTPYELIVVNDDSPEPEIWEFLREITKRENVTVIENIENVGFVASVNHALSLHAERDVILLNSDTRVANDWLDRLLACAEREPTAGTITPFTNNGTICSYPFEGFEADLPGTLDLNALDAIFANSLKGRSVEIPTAVGFCMYIRRSCLNQIGGFNQQAFGRGYGEENDFSMRALKGGWKNLLCADVFVYHKGSVSFGDERFLLMKSGEKALLELHPDYYETLREFFSKDTVRGLREAIDRSRVTIGGNEALSVLSELHAQLQLLSGRSIQSSDNNAQVLAVAKLDDRGFRSLLLEVLALGVDRVAQSKRWGRIRRAFVVRFLILARKFVEVIC